MMFKSDEKGRARLALRLSFVAAILISAFALAACGSSSSSSSESTSSEATQSEESSGSGSSESSEAGSGGSPETSAYAEGVPTLKELYEGTEEAPPTSGPKAAPGKEVIVISCGNESPGCAVPSEEFVEAAEALGWKAKILDAKLNINNGNSNAIRTAIAAHPDAIVPFAINCVEGKSAFEEAKSAGIPLVEDSAIDCGTGSEKLWTVEESFNKDFKSTGEFYEKFGEDQAAYLVDKTEGKAKVLATEFAGPFGKSMNIGSTAIFKKCAECEVLENLSFEGAEQAPGGPLSQRFTTSLTKYPEANAALLAFDSVATFSGASKAIVDAGRANSMVVVAGEGFAESKQLIAEEAGLNAEGAAYDSARAQWGVADNLNRYFNGEPVVPQGVGLTVVDKEHNLEPVNKNYETKIDYKKAYEKIWTGK